MERPNRRWPIGLLAALAFLATCGPVNQTERILTPPTGPEAQQCVTECNTDRGQCLEKAAERYADCREQQREAYDDFRNCRGGTAARTGAVLCLPRATFRCRSRAPRCEAAFEVCYQRCGGKVEKQEVCVANCD